MQPVVNPDDASVFDEAVRGLRYASPAKGGATRQASVRAGLEALVAAKPDIVLIHDAARPFVSPALISRAIDAASTTGAAIPAIPVADTIKLVDGSGRVEATPERARLADCTDAPVVPLRRRSSRHTGAPRARDATISPTTRRWPNGWD